MIGTITRVPLYTYMLTPVLCFSISSINRIHDAITRRWPVFRLIRCVNFSSSPELHKFSLLFMCLFYVERSGRNAFCRWFNNRHESPTRRSIWEEADLWGRKAVAWPEMDVFPRCRGYPIGRLRCVSYRFSYGSPQSSARKTRWNRRRGSGVLWRFFPHDQILRGKTKCINLKKFWKLFCACTNDTNSWYHYRKYWTNYVVIQSVNEICLRRNKKFGCFLLKKIF